MVEKLPGIKTVYFTAKHFSCHIIKVPLIVDSEKKIEKIYHIASVCN